MPTRVDRLSPADVTQLATDVGPVPLNVGAVLAVPGADPHALAALLAGRLATVRRFRQAVHHVPFGCGRPCWVDDPAFDLAAHVRVVHVPDLDEAALGDVGAREVITPLDLARPPWRVTVAHDDDGRVAAVLVLHHVLADGVGGLGVLASLADGVAPALGGPPPAAAGTSPVTAAPRVPVLLADAWRERGVALRRLPTLVRGLRRAGTELGARSTGDRAAPDGQAGTDRTGHAGAAPASGLNARTGPHRAVHLAGVDLAAVRAGARRHGATINDALLVAAAAAMHDVLVDRGAPAPEALVLSVPVSGRPPTGARPAGTAPGPDLGNQVGVMPVRTPTTGPLADRLAAVAAHTRARKAGRRGASAVLVAPLFRLLAAVRLYRWFVDRQRLVNGFLTNLRGPAEQLCLGGRPITRIVPVTITAGNVGVSFAALSYAGRLGVSVVTDPDTVPEGAALAARVESVLGRVAAPADR